MDHSRGCRPNYFTNTAHRKLIRGSMNLMRSKIKTKIREEIIRIEGVWVAICVKIRGNKVIKSSER